MQPAIFEAFDGFLSAIIEDARQAGTLDVGLETLRADKFEIVDRKVIFEHEATGATAIPLTVERTDRNDPLTLPGSKPSAQIRRVRRSVGTRLPNARP